VFANIRAVTEAELAAHGIHPMSIAHGTPETDEDTALVYRELPRLAEECGTLAGTRGGNEYITYRRHGVHRPGAGDRASVVACHAHRAPRVARVSTVAERCCRAPGHAVTRVRCVARRSRAPVAATKTPAATGIGLWQDREPAPRGS
jgi:hypothetical protein